MLTLAREGGANPNDVFDGTGTLTLTDGQVLLQETEQEREPIDIIVGTYANADGILASPSMRTRPRPASTPC